MENVENAPGATCSIFLTRFSRGDATFVGLHATRATAEAEAAGAEDVMVDEVENIAVQSEYVVMTIIYPDSDTNHLRVYEDEAEAEADEYVQALPDDVEYELRTMRLFP